MTSGVAKKRLTGDGIGLSVSVQISGVTQQAPIFEGQETPSEIGFRPAGDSANFSSKCRGDDELGAGKIGSVVSQVACGIENRVAVPMAREHRRYAMIHAALNEFRPAGSKNSTAPLGLPVGGRLAGKDRMMELHKHGLAACIREFPLKPRELRRRELVPPVGGIQAENSEGAELHPMPGVGSKMAQILDPCLALVIARA